MTKKTFFFIILILFSNLVIAQDGEFFIPNTGDIQSYLLEVVGDSQFMNFFYDLLTITEEEVGDSSLPPVQYFDVIVKLDKQEYRQGKTVEATITIINNGDTPDKDAILKYHLVSPDGRKLLESQEHRIEAPIVTYDKGNCHKYGGIVERGRCMLKVDLEMKLPDKAQLGDGWKFSTEYITVKQGKLEDYAGFRVVESSFIIRCVKEHPLLFLLSIIILLIIIIGLIIDDVKQRN